MVSTSSEMFDSLPYFDNELDQFPNLKEKVQQELAQELGTTSTLHPSIPPPITLFANNPLLAAEIARVEAQESFTLDSSRHQLPAPTTIPATDEEWKSALDNAKAQLEHQRIRHANISLLQTYGPNAWRIHNYLLETTETRTEKALEDLNRLTVEVNRERKNYQTRLGNQLNSLEARWAELVSSILQIEMANEALVLDVENLRKKEMNLTAV